MFVSRKVALGVIGLIIGVMVLAVSIRLVFWPQPEPLPNSQWFQVPPGSYGGGPRARAMDRYMRNQALQWRNEGR